MKYDEMQVGMPMYLTLPIDKIEANISSVFTPTKMLLVSCVISMNTPHHSIPLTIIHHN